MTDEGGIERGFEWERDFPVLYEETRQSLCSLTSEREVIEDCLGEAARIMYEKSLREPILNPSAYMLRVAKNRLSMHYRTYRRRESICPTCPFSDALPANSPMPSPEDEYLNGEMGKCIDRAIADLGQSARVFWRTLAEVVEGPGKNGYTKIPRQEVAELSGLSLAALGKVIYRTQPKLQGALSEYKLKG